MLFCLTIFISSSSSSFLLLRRTNQNLNPTEPNQEPTSTIAKKGDKRIMGSTSKSFISPYSRTLSLTFVVVVVLFLLLPFQIQSDHSIYDHLRTNGLPIGLLPKGITDYSLDPTSGRFQINLTRPCNAKFESQLHYDFNVSGLLSFGKMGNLSGISQQELFLWFPVKCIRVDVPSSGLIYFDVGVVDKQFSLSLFENPRDCHEVDLSPSDSFKNESEQAVVEILRGDALHAVL